MGYAQDLVAAGYSGYQGWGDNEALANFNATKGAGKFPQGGGGGNNGGTQVNNFDFAAEATKAYGELGLYYDRLLKESQGDTTKVLSRLTEDYNTGARNQAQDTAYANQQLDTSKTNAIKTQTDSLLNRGLFQRSAYDPAAANPADPTQGTGLGNILMQQTTSPFDVSKNRNNDLLTRWTEGAKTTLGRNTEDANLKQTRYASELQRNRAVEAAQLSNMRGQGGADYLKYMNNPALT